MYNEDEINRLLEAPAVYSSNLVGESTNTRERKEKRRSRAKEL